MTQFLIFFFFGGAGGTHALVTEEFTEVFTREAVVADPARVTEIFAEPARFSNAPADLPVNAIRFTQQTVEVLYLEPEPLPSFDDCGAFSGVREWEARLYDDKNPTTGKRKAY